MKTTSAIDIVFETPVHVSNAFPTRSTPTLQYVFDSVPLLPSNCYPQLILPRVKSSVSLIMHLCVLIKMSQSKGPILYMTGYWLEYLN